MIVTKTEAVAKTRYRVYIDGQFAFVLYKSELSRYQVREGQELGEGIYEKIRAEVLVKRAKIRAMHLLNAMGRTEAQLRMKLGQGGYPEDVVDEALSYVKSFGYVDNLNYARSFIAGRKEKKSRKEIFMLLKGKGVSEEEIGQAMEECYEEEDCAAAIQKIMDKRGYDPDRADYKERQKIMAYLVRKGFPYEDVRKACGGYAQEDFAL